MHARRDGLFAHRKGLTLKAYYLLNRIDTSSARDIERLINDNTGSSMHNKVNLKVFGFMSSHAYSGVEIFNPIRFYIEVTIIHRGLPLS